MSTSLDSRPDPSANPLRFCIEILNACAAGKTWVVICHSQPQVSTLIAATCRMLRHASVFTDADASIASDGVSVRFTIGASAAEIIFVRRDALPALAGQRVHGYSTMATHVSPDVIGYIEARMPPPAQGT